MFKLKRGLLKLLRVFSVLTANHELCIKNKQSFYQVDIFS